MYWPLFWASKTEEKQKPFSKNCPGGPATSTSPVNVTFLIVNYMELQAQSIFFLSKQTGRLRFC